MRRPNTTPDQRSLYPDQKGFRPHHSLPVGGVLLADEQIEYNVSRKTRNLTVRNRGDRPIQVGSHFHFFEVNRHLSFDRAAAFGFHLNIPATTAIRFEPGDSREVELVAYGGKQRITGFNSLVEGYAGCENEPSFYPVRGRALSRVRRMGFMSQEDDSAPTEMDAEQTSAMESEPADDKTAEKEPVKSRSKATERPTRRSKQTKSNQTENE